MASIASYDEPKVFDAFELSQQPNNVLMLKDERNELPYMQRIAVVGRMHAGKSTVAKVFAGAGFKQVALADEVKELAVQAANAVLIRPSFFLPRQIKSITRADVDRDKARYRGLLQWIGTYGREAITPDIWIKIFEAKYLTSGSQTRYVVDDMRFPNEANALRTKGFAIIKVERDEKERKASVAKSFRETMLRDPSKKELKQFLNADSEIFVDEIKPDIIIKNNFTLVSLQNAATRVVGRNYGY